MSTTNGSFSDLEWGMRFACGILVIAIVSLALVFLTNGII